MPSYRIDIISLFPKAFEPLYNLGVIGRAFTNKIAELYIHNPRDFTNDNYSKVDDEPYGGGAGMVLKPEPFFNTFRNISFYNNKRVILMCPQGKPLNQGDLKRWATNYEQIILICGQYEGFDERIRTIADEEISAGDFVLTGGEIPAMLITNGVVRLLPGTVGSNQSLFEESHNDLLLDYPQYTRPANFDEMPVPEVLLSGNHSEIKKWREEQRISRTKERRPDLYKLWLKKYRQTK